MRSIGARLATAYALASTLTLAVATLAGYYAIRTHLVAGLDALNRSEFQQIGIRLGPDVATLTPADIEARIREATEAASVLFFVEVHNTRTGAYFRSNNLHGNAVPDVRGAHRYDATISGIGALRVGEFVLPPYDVTVATSEAQIADILERYGEIAAALVALMLAVSVMIGAGFSRYALRPIRLISETARRISSENLGDRIPVSSVQDEVAALAGLLNETFDRLQASFLSVRRFAADASHELKTPLALVRLHAEKLLTSGRLGPEDEEVVVTILEELDRLSALIEDLLFLSRAEARSVALNATPQDPLPCLQSFCADAQVLTEHRGLRFEWRHDGAGDCVFDARAVRRVLLNLLSNAVHASPPGGVIRLTSTLAPDSWHVSVEDQGPGVPASDRERIFERFVRLGAPADGPVGGSGLGLAICRSLIELHGGSISAGPASGGSGLCVSFRLPTPRTPGHGVARLPG